MKRSDIISLFFAITFMAVFVFGCVSLGRIAPPVDDALLASTGIMTVADRTQLMLGRNVYLTDCTKCHVAYPIDDYEIDEWTQSILPEMNHKSRLDDDEALAVEAYIHAAIKHLATMPPE